MSTLDFWLQNYTTILGWLGSAGAIAIVLQFAKKKWNIDGKKTLHTLVSLLSLLPVAIDYIANYGQQYPGVIPKNFAFVFTLAVTLHRFLVGPIYNKIEQFFQVTYANAQKYEQEQAQATPVTVKPATNKPVQIQDFTIDSVVGDQ